MKFIIASNTKRTKQQMRSYSDTLVAVPADVPYDYYDRSGSIGLLFNFQDCYRALLDGNIKKPCIGVEALDVNAENELTLDVLRLVYNAGKVDKWVKDAAKNFKLQLNVLNNHNWREYPATICVLMYDILYNSRLVREIRSRKSLLSKPEKKLLCDTYVDWRSGTVSDKDMNMLKSFLEDLFHIGDKKFTDIQTVLDKINEVGINIDTFSRFYNNIVKIEPIKYANN